MTREPESRPHGADEETEALHGWPAPVTCQRQLWERRAVLR